MADDRRNVRYRTIRAGDADVFFREAGPPDAPTVVLLHGFPSSSFMFRNLIFALADQYHVLAPDYPGFGYSAFPPRATFRYSFEHFAEVVDPRGRTPAPTLVVWGRHDPFFTVRGAEAYPRDNPTAEVHLLDAGHFALETAGAGIASLMRDFLTRQGDTNDRPIAR